MMWRIAAVGLIVAFVGIILSELGFKGKRVFSALCITLILAAFVSEATDMLSSVIKIAESSGVGDAAAVAVKVVGVGYVFGFVSDISEELGERGVASAVSLVGRLEIVMLIFPFFLEICELGMGISGAR